MKTIAELIAEQMEDYYNGEYADSGVVKYNLLSFAHQVLQSKEANELLKNHEEISNPK